MFAFTVLMQLVWLLAAILLLSSYLVLALVDLFYFFGYTYFVHYIIAFESSLNIVMAMSFISTKEDDF
jgi:uncharacterized membrane protein YesL